MKITSNKYSVRKVKKALEFHLKRLQTQAYANGEILKKLQEDNYTVQSGITGLLNLVKVLKP